MLVEIITIGDELLIGQVVDTNSAWMGQELSLAGFKVKQITSISDDEQAILTSLDDAKKRADVILITGGLGPTKDDITKITLCKYFNTNLVFNQPAYDNIEILFKRRGREVTLTNRKQAEVPENCMVLQNKNGTAPGMLFEQHGRVFVSMPGVPYEMKSMMTDDVLPFLKKKFTTPKIIHKTIITQGIGESFLSDMISDWENNLPANMKLAYLPSSSMVRLRLTATGNAIHLAHEVDEQLKKVLPIIEKYVFGFDDDTLQEIVGKLLLKSGKKLALAESCTGGYISHLITSIPGSSVYYTGSIVAYAYEIKEDYLDVPKQVLASKGAVSEEVVIQMAKQVKENFKTDYAIAVSGIAGPDGGTADKPVGTVWIAVATPNHITAKRFQFGTNRMRNIEITSYTALNMLRKEIIANESV